jgi:hypothetical protein
MAIRDSGLSLDRVHYRLTQRGVKISVATLSHWQSGRSRPERTTSLSALEELEYVLGVPKGALQALVGPPRPRGRKVRQDLMLPIGDLWATAESTEALLAEVDTSSDRFLSRISQHDRLWVSADRVQRTISVRQILRADRDGVDRFVVAFFIDTDGRPLPELHALRGCRTGNVVVDTDASVMVAELLFDHPLARGETLIMEHEFVHPEMPQLSPVGHDAYTRSLRLPTREYVLEVHFDLSALPSRCEEVWVPADQSSPARYRKLTLDSEGRAHAVALGIGPGNFGIRWQWTE